MVYINGLNLNLDKTNIMQFNLNYSSNISLQITCCETNVQQLLPTKFLGLNLDDQRNSKMHIDKITPTLSRACYIIRSVCFLNNISTFKTIYYAYFHSVMEYSIIFWDKLPSSKKVFHIYI